MRETEFLAEIHRLKVAINRIGARLNAASVEIEHAERIAREAIEPTGEGGA